MVLTDTAGDCDQRDQIPAVLLILMGLNGELNDSQFEIWKGISKNNCRLIYHVFYLMLKMILIAYWVFPKK